MIKSVYVLVFCALVSACAQGAHSSRFSERSDRITTAATPSGNAEGRRSGAKVNPRDGDQPRSDAAAHKSSIYVGSGRFVRGFGSDETVETAVSDDAVTLNLIGAPIEQAAKTILGDMLGLTYVIAEGVSGEVTLQSGAPIERDALLAVLETVLRSKGVAIVDDGNILRIVPLATALRGGVSPRARGGASLAGFGVHIEPLRYISAVEMARVLEPIAPEGAVLRIDKARNLLMLAGTQVELASLLETVDIFDVDWLAGMSFGMFPIKSTSPAVMIEELDEIFARGEEGPLEGMIRLVPNERLGAVMAITPNGQLLEHVQMWVDRLDGAGAGASEQLYVYHVQHGIAEELGAVLEGVLTGRGANARRQSSVAPSLEASEFNASAAGGAQASSSFSASGFQAGASSPLLSGERVNIYPYDGKNALVIVATPQDYEIILNILEQLDVISNQVLLEATIAEVTLRDELNFGLQWFFEEGDSEISFSRAANGAVAPSFPGFSYLFSRSDVRVALDALSSITDVNIISSPSLMVVDNKTATLQVGDEVPVATQSSVSNNINTPIFNSISFRDTGIILSITPRVNDSGVVLLEIEQEVSDVVSTTTSGIDSPTIQQRRIQTTVAVQDGQTLALGGLIEDGVTGTRSGVPIVSEIPLLGNLFKSRTDRKERTELLVMITPRVIRNMSEAAEVTDEFRRRLNAIAPLEGRLNGD